MFFFRNENRKYENKHEDFYYVRLRQQTLSLGGVDLRQQNNLFKNYCKPPRVKSWLTLSSQNQIIVLLLQDCFLH